MTTLSISIQSILKQVHALSALHSHLTATPSAVKPFLTDDNHRGLIPILNEALSFVAVDLISFLQVVTPPSEADELIEIEVNIVKLPRHTDKIFEAVMAQRMLQILYAPHSEQTSSQFAKMATDSTLKLHDMLRQSSLSTAPSALRWNGY